MADNVGSTIDPFKKFESDLGETLEKIMKSTREVVPQDSYALEDFNNRLKASVVQALDSNQGAISALDNWNSVESFFVVGNPFPNQANGGNILEATHADIQENIDLATKLLKEQNLSYEQLSAIFSELKYESQEAWTRKSASMEASTALKSDEITINAIERGDDRSQSDVTVTFKRLNDTEIEMFVYNQINHRTDQTFLYSDDREKSEEMWKQLGGLAGQAKDNPKDIDVVRQNVDELQMNINEGKFLEIDGVNFVQSQNGKDISMTRMDGSTMPATFVDENGEIWKKLQAVDTLEKDMDNPVATRLMLDKIIDKSEGSREEIESDKVLARFNLATPKVAETRIPADISSTTSISSSPAAASASTVSVATTDTRDPNAGQTLVSETAPLTPPPEKLTPVEERIQNNVEQAGRILTNLDTNKGNSQNTVGTITSDEFSAIGRQAKNVLFEKMDTNNNDIIEASELNDVLATSNVKIDKTALAKNGINVIPDQPAIASDPLVVVAGERLDLKNNTKLSEALKNFGASLNMSGESVKFFAVEKTEINENKSPQAAPDPKALALATARAEAGRGQT